MQSIIHLKLGDAFHSRNLEQALQLYHALRDEGVLGKREFAWFARFLHSEHRLLTAKRKKKAEILGHARSMIKDLQNGAAPPCPAAAVRLLTLLKEGHLLKEGVEFWNWLSRQDDAHVSSHVYGAAMELLALCGTDLKTQEALFQEALKRFGMPNSYAEYHFSPYAILHDPGQPQYVKGTSQNLLQGIICARLYGNDVYNAYLGLDTALRLFHGQVSSRTFDAFWEKRTPDELYKLMMIALRSGIAMKTTHLEQLMSMITERIQFYTTSYMKRLQLAERMVSVLKAYIGAGLRTDKSAEYMLIKCMSYMLPPKLEESEPSESEPHEITDSHSVEEQARRKVCSLAKDTFEFFVRKGAGKDYLSYFSAYIRLLGKGRQRNAIGELLQQMNNAGYHPGKNTYRAILNAVGRLEDAQLVQSTWKALVHASTDLNTSLLPPDWNALFYAGVRAGCTDFVDKQVAEAGETVMDLKEDFEKLYKQQQEELVTFNNQNTGQGDSEATENGPSKENVGNEKYIPTLALSRIDHIHKEVHTLFEMMEKGTRINLYKDQPLLDLVVRAKGPLASSPAVMKEVYRRLNTDPYLPSSAPPKPDPKPVDKSRESAEKTGADGSEVAASDGTFPADVTQPPPIITASGYPLDELRLANWTAMSEILVDLRAAQSKAETEGEEGASEAGRKKEGEGVTEDFGKYLRGWSVSHVRSLDIVNEFGDGWEGGKEEGESGVEGEKEKENEKKNVEEVEIAEGFEEEVERVKKELAGLRFTKE